MQTIFLSTNRIQLEMNLRKDLEVPKYLEVKQHFSH